LRVYGHALPGGMETALQQLEAVVRPAEGE
jgi:hypothetical protein